MAGVPVIGSYDEAAYFLLGHTVNLFEYQLHFGRAWRTHDKSDGLAVRPALGLRFANFDQLARGDGFHGIGFVGNQRKVARCRERCGKQHENEKTNQALARQFRSPTALDEQLTIILLEPRQVA
jgi:hypothetical protein